MATPNLGVLARQALQMAAQRVRAPSWCLRGGPHGGPHPDLADLFKIFRPLVNLPVRMRFAACYHCIGELPADRSSARFYVDS